MGVENQSSRQLIEEMVQELKDVLEDTKDKNLKKDAIEQLKAGQLAVAKTAQDFAADAAAGKTIVGSARSTSSHIIAVSASGLPNISEAIQVIVPLAIAMDVISNVVQFFARKTQSYGMTKKEKYIAYAFNTAGIVLSAAAMATFFTLAFFATAAIFSVYGAIDSFKEFRNLYRNHKANKTIDSQLKNKAAELDFLKKKLIATQTKEHREWKIEALKKKIEQVERHVGALQKVKDGTGLAADHRIVNNWNKKAKEDYANSRYYAVTRGLTSIGYGMVAIPIPPVMIAGGIIVATVALTGVGKLAVGAITKRWKNRKERKLINKISKRLNDEHPRDDILLNFVSEKAEKMYIRKEFEKHMINNPDPTEMEERYTQFKDNFYEGLSEQQKKSIKHEALLAYAQSLEEDKDGLGLMHELKEDYPAFKAEKMEEEILRKHFREYYLSEFEPKEGASPNEVKEAKKQKKIALKGIKKAEDHYLKNLSNKEKLNLLATLGVQHKEQRDPSQLQEPTFLVHHLPTIHETDGSTPAVATQQGDKKEEASMSHIQLH